MTQQTAILQDTVDHFRGIIGYGFGDVNDQGQVRSLPTPVLSNGTSTDHRGIDIPPHFQLFPPITFLLSLRYITPTQHEALLKALNRLRAEFRLR